MKFRPPLALHNIKIDESEVARLTRRRTQHVTGIASDAEESRQFRRRSRPQCQSMRDEASAQAAAELLTSVAGFKSSHSKKLRWCTTPLFSGWMIYDIAMFSTCTGVMLHRIEADHMHFDVMWHNKSAKGESRRTRSPVSLRELTLRKCTQCADRLAETAP